MSKAINPEGFFVFYKWKALEDWQESIAVYKKGAISFTVVGKNLPDDKNYLYKFWGEWITHPKYGAQFKTTYHELMVDKDSFSLIRYLSSDSFYGIGKATATRIVNYFGENVLDILDKNIEEIYQVPQLSKKKQKCFIEQYRNNRNQTFRDVIITLSKYDISYAQAIQVYKHFENENIFEIIEKQPYRLAAIPGITFKKADNIGCNTQEYELNENRFLAGANYILDCNLNTGTIYLNGQIVKLSPAGSIGISRSLFENVIFNLLYKSFLTKEKVYQYIQNLINQEYIYECLIHDTYYIFPARFYNLEQKIAQNIIRLSQPYIHAHITKKDIEKVEEYLGKKYNTTFLFSDEQRLAIKHAFAYGLSLIIGPPGTGKTTVIEGIRLV